MLTQQHAPGRGVTGASAAFSAALLLASACCLLLAPAAVEARKVAAIGGGGLGGGGGGGSLSLHQYGRHLLACPAQPSAWCTSYYANCIDVVCTGTPSTGYSIYVSLRKSTTCATDVSWAACSRLTTTGKGTQCGTVTECKNAAGGTFGPSSSNDGQYCGQVTYFTYFVTDSSVISDGRVGLQVRTCG
ncbi:hypothetical protein HYH02_011100 [Chlamydomonas schloesseri]|uniref:Uncharacterized protein n=1 Tax=Chlamydomonas schloesseri TaxID=2026947 RepID=A0A835T2F4_9CHLO|nr:hypothetical protein HYH02_011100 [Chlamydomonas schloesseri]|eukprot:KAG2437722.1 hypothetical protein HYH02_011100 [Chlamydomonas schloesseri]